MHFRNATNKLVYPPKKSAQPLAENRVITELQLLAENRGITELLSSYPAFSSKRLWFRITTSTWFLHEFSPLEFPPTRSANVRLLAENRGFTELLFCYPEFSSRLRFQKNIYSTWFYLEYPPLDFPPILPNSAASSFVRRCNCSPISIIHQLRQN